ncbi:MAG: YqgE/AlgH family protein [Pseudohongiellaceae bacterium]
MSESFSSNLAHQFLIAMPRLMDPYFAGTVTYLWKHNADGALGIVINKPLAASVGDIFDELEIVCAGKESFRRRQVLAGGPVERDKGFIVHDSDKSWESSICVVPGISICTSRQILQDIAAGRGPDNFMVALGCAGWDAGQLEQEISDNAWLTAPVSPELLFSTDYLNKAAKAAAALGVDLTQLSPDAGHS